MSYLHLRSDTHNRKPLQSFHYAELAMLGEHKIAPGEPALFRSSPPVIHSFPGSWRALGEPYLGAISRGALVSIGSVLVARKSWLGSSRVTSPKWTKIGAMASESPATTMRLRSA